MSKGKLWMAVAVTLLAQPAFAAKVEERDGGGSRSAVVAAGSQHASGSSHAVPRTPGASGVTGPQARHPRAGTGTGGYYYGHYGHYGHGYYPYYPYGFYGGFYWGSPYYYGGYYPYYGAPYGPGPGYAYGYGSSVRLIVKPEATKVYVDGYYAGVVDDFDGIFQHLNLPPGRHEVSLKLDGFRTHRFRVYVPVDQTLKIHYEMARGAGEDPSDDVIGTPPERDEQDQYTRRDDNGTAGPYPGNGNGPGPTYPPAAPQYNDDNGGYENGNVNGPESFEANPPSDDSADRGAGMPADEAGTLRLDVRPDDASVYVDGAFRGTARDLVGVALDPGHHRIEVVRPGFRTVERELDMEPGGNRELSIELER